MHTIYAFDNALLGANGDNFAAALVGQHEGTQEECLAWFEAEYGSNDYTASFTEPQ